MCQQSLGYRVELIVGPVVIGYRHCIVATTETKCVSTGRGIPLYNDIDIIIVIIVDSNKSKNNSDKSRMLMGLSAIKCAFHIKIYIYMYIYIKNMDILWRMQNKMR